MTVAVASARFIVSGRVQGVFFRASAKREAERLGITGHARNLADGDVDVLAHGSNEAIAAFERWLRHGPVGARVDAVTRVAADDSASARFDVL